MTASWASGPVLALDTETTGVDTSSDRIVELATILIHPDGTTSDPFHRIINPGVEIPDEAAGIHGITTARAAAEGKTPTHVLRGLCSRLNAHHGPVVIYNATFDWPLLLAECARHALPRPATPRILDPLVLDKHLTERRRGKGCRKLTHVAGLYGVTLTDEDAHGALADATAAGHLLWAMTRQHPKMLTVDLDELQSWQARWHEAQRQNFTDYMRRSVDATFEGDPPGWPIPQATAA